MLIYTAYLDFWYSRIFSSSGDFCLSCLCYHVFMQIKQIRDQQRAICSPLPQSYAGLMEMYETNYMKIRLLCGDVRSLDDQIRSTVAEGVPVLLRVLERSAHTTTIMLTYQFDKDYSKNKPDLRIRIYHDSRQAEVISRKCRLKGKTLNSWEESVNGNLLCRWRLNRFLYKWINYLSRQGHSFSAGS